MDVDDKVPRRTDERITAIKQRITHYPDFPKPGVLFRDVFPLARRPSLLPSVVDLFYERLISHHQGKKVDIVVGIDSRGFLFGPELARKIGADFVPARKKGKLPGEIIQAPYALEYGHATLEIQKEYLVSGQQAVIVDDLISTGGTMAAAHYLLTNSGVEVLECQCIVGPEQATDVDMLPKGCSLYCLVNF